MKNFNRSKLKIKNSEWQEAVFNDYSDSQIELVKQEFSKAKDYAAEYDQSNSPIAHLFNIRLRRVSELLEDLKNGKILDVGCGPAKIRNAFRGKPIEYYGIDLSKEMIKEGIQNSCQDAQSNFSLGRIEELPYPNSYFDVVLCLGAMEYVPKANKAISEMKRVLKPSGILIITMLNGRSVYRIWQRYVFWKIVNGINKFTRLKARTRITKR